MVELFLLKINNNMIISENISTLKLEIKTENEL